MEKFEMKPEKEKNLSTEAELPKDSIKDISFSKDCKLWKFCKNKECIEELKAVYGKNWKKGTIIWSLEVCYDLHDLIKNGLVVNNGSWSDFK